MMPQSMQISNEFLIKVNKQHDNDNLNAMLQSFKGKIHIKTYKCLLLKKEKKFHNQCSLKLILKNK